MWIKHCLTNSKHQHINVGAKRSVLWLSKYAFQIINLVDWEWDSPPISNLYSRHSTPSIFLWNSACWKIFEWWKGKVPDTLRRSSSHGLEVGLPSGELPCRRRLRQCVTSEDSLLTPLNRRFVWRTSVNEQRTVRSSSIDRFTSYYLTITDTTLWLLMPAVNRILWSSDFQRQLYLTMSETS